MELLMPKGFGFFYNLVKIMKITDSSISLNSSSFKAKSLSIKENFRFWVNNNEEKPIVNHPPDNRINPTNLHPNDPNSVGYKGNKSSAKTDKLDLNEEVIKDSEFGWKLQLIVDLFETFFEEDTDLSFLKDIIKFRNEIPEETRKLNDKRNELINPPQNEEFGWGLEYDREEIRYEKQMMQFSATGVVKTADGKSIGFNFNLEISSEILEKNSVSVRAGDAQRKDPLVLNFAGTSAMLSGNKFLFDIDYDGINDKIPYLNSGSGFLAFDRNNDNKINNGSELFGTKSGNGFADLSAYDEDKNGWIDESDAIFDKLSVWEKNKNQDNLSSLKDKNIGAIYLRNTNSNFEFKSSLYNELGEIRKSGLFLKESGEPGSIQQLDFFV